MQHKKFIFENFDKAMVVNREYHNNQSEPVSELDGIISGAVMKHFTELADHNNEQFQHHDGEANDSIIMPDVDGDESELSVDNDLAENQARIYEDAIEKLKSEYEQKISELEHKLAFSGQILEKFAHLPVHHNPEKQIVTICSQVVSQIANKLYLSLPAKFNNIFNGLLKMLKKSYKNGRLTITLHSQNYDLCKELLASDENFAIIQDNIEIIKDDNLTHTDCKVDWQDTRFEYNQEQLSLEVNKIIEQLKTSTQEG